MTMQSPACADHARRLATIESDYVGRTELLPQIVRMEKKQDASERKLDQVLDQLTTIAANVEILRLSTRETSAVATIALSKASRANGVNDHSNGIAIPVANDSWDEKTDQIPAERIMRHSAAQGLVQRAEDAEKRKIALEKSRIVWTTVSAAIATVVTAVLANLPKLIGLFF